MELEVLKRLLVEPEATLRELNRYSDFPKIFDDHKDALKTALAHFKKYGKMPDIKTFESKTGLSLPTKVPEPTRYYIDSLVEIFSNTRLQRVSRKFEDFVNDGKLTDAVTYMEDNLRALRGFTRASATYNLVDTVPERVKAYDDRRGMSEINGIPCGWMAIDVETMGWQETDLVYILARMSTFKSWVLFAWATNAWLSGYTPILFSKEMRYLQIARRIDTYLAKVTFSLVRKGKLSDSRFTAFSKSLKDIYKDKHPYYVVDTAGDSRYDVEFVRNQIREHKVDCAYVDGTYLLDSLGDSETERQKNTSRALKRITLDESVPIIATTQANRGSAGKKGSKVRLDHAQYTDAYAQDGDVVYGFDRGVDKLTGRPENAIIVNNLKMRDGTSAALKVTVDLDSMMFIEEDVDPEDLMREDEDSAPSISEGDLGSRIL